MSKRSAISRVIMGVDACRAGWLGISMDVHSRQLEAHVFGSIDELFAQTTGTIAIDIPIGLPDSGDRGCDKAARAALGKPRSCSVFCAPIRAAINAGTHLEATRITKARDKRGVSAQSWGIFKKILAVDACLRASKELRQRVYEVHPEVSFWAWNRFRSMRESKKKGSPLF